MDVNRHLEFGNNSSSSDFESDEDESICDEEISQSVKWKMTFERDIDDICIVQPKLDLDKWLLGEAEKEIVEILKRILKVVKVPSLENLSIENIFCYWIGDFCFEMYNHVNEVLSRQYGSSHITVSDIIDFVMINVVSSAYMAGPTLLREEAAFFPASMGKMSDALASLIRSTLSKPKYAQEPFTSDKGMHEMQAFMNAKCRSAFVNKVSIIALDNDKLSAKPNELRKINLVAKKVKENWGPVNHCVSSVLTGLHLGSCLELADSSVSPINTLFHALAGAQLRDGVINPKDISVENLITKDRGYNAQGFSQVCLDMNGQELGIRKRENNFYYTFDRTPHENQECIEEKGHSVARWCETKIESNEGARYEICGAAWRCGGRVSLLQTSSPIFGKFKWSYRLARSSNLDNEFEESLCPLEIHQARQLLHDVKGRFLEITKAQSTPEWFLLRRFRITSAVLSSIGIQWFQRGLREYKEHLDLQTGSPELDSLFDSQRGVCMYLGFVFIEGESSVGSTTSMDRSGEANRLVDLLDKPALVQLCEAHCTRQEGECPFKNQSKGPLAKKLVDCGLNIDILLRPHEIQNFKQLLHDTWFVKPLKLQTFEIEQDNKPMIRKLLPEFVQENSPFDLLSCSQLGLVANLQEVYLATSVDGIVILRRTHRGMDDNVSLPTTASTEPLIPAILQIKTRSEQQARQNIRRMVHDEGKSFFQVDVATQLDRFHKLVSDCGSRCQIVHHCIVTKVYSALYVECSGGKIAYAVLLTIPMSLCDSLLRCCYRPMYEMHMRPVIEKLDHRYDENTNILEEFGINPGFAVDELTYRQAYLLSKKLLQIVLQNQCPLPPSKRIVPFIVDSWSYLKVYGDMQNNLLSHSFCVDKGMSIFGKYILGNLHRLLMNCHTTLRLLEILNEVRAANHSFETHFHSFQRYKTRLKDMPSLRKFYIKCTGLGTVLRMWTKPLQKQMRPTTNIQKPVVKNPYRKSENTSRLVRQFWNEGAFKPYRVNPSNDSHYISKQGHHKKRDIVGNIVKTDKASQRRCVVCCSECLSGRAHQYRLGLKTAYGCRDCGRHAQHFDDTQTDIVPLCELKRFERVQGEKYDEYRELTCFEIHHSGLTYPKFPCCNNETGRVMATPRTREPRQSYTSENTYTNSSPSTISDS